MWTEWRVLWHSGCHCEIIIKGCRTWPYRVAAKLISTSTGSADSHLYLTFTTIFCLKLLRFSILKIICKYLISEEIMVAVFAMQTGWTKITSRLTSISFVTVRPRRFWRDPVAWFLTNSSTSRLYSTGAAPQTWSKWPHESDIVGTFGLRETVSKVFW